MLRPRFTLSLCAMLALACGARSPLDDAQTSEPVGQGAGGPSTGGAGPGGGGGGQGGTPVVTCDEVVLTPVISLSTGGLETGGLRLVDMQHDPATACLVADFFGGLGATAVGFACVEAWGRWPLSLGTTTFIGPNVGGVAVGDGRDAGFSLLLGNVAGANPSGATFAPNVEAGDTVPLSISLPEYSDHRALFVERSPRGDHYGGLASQDGIYESVGLLRITPEIGLVDAVSDLACAEGPMVTQAVAFSDRVLIATSAGREFSLCALGDGLPALPTRLQLMSFTFDGVWELRFEAAHEQIVTDVALVDAGGGDVWLGWTVGGQVFVARIEPAGSIVLGPIFISDTSVGPIALAMRGEELLVGHIDASDPDLASDVQVTAVSAEGDTRSFGGFDTADAPWNGEISLLVSADETKVIVAYRGSAFDSLPQPFARRFDCVQ